MGDGESAVRLRQQTGLMPILVSYKREYHHLGRRVVHYVLPECHQKQGTSLRLPCEEVLELSHFAGVLIAVSSHNRLLHTKDLMSCFVWHQV